MQTWPSVNVILWTSMDSAKQELRPKLRGKAATQNGFHQRCFDARPRLGVLQFAAVNQFIVDRPLTSLFLSFLRSHFENVVFKVCDSALRACPRSVMLHALSIN